MAGHTHCGQITIPGLQSWSYHQLTGAERIVIEEWAPSGYGTAGNQLYVTCGIGFSLLPMRIAALPQVVFFDLHPAR